MHGLAPLRNTRQRMSGHALLRQMPADCARLAFLDPQYRGVLDHLDFGNEGARQIKRAVLPQMTDRDIASLIEEIERVLRPSGHLMLWIDKFMLGTGRHLGLLRWAPEIQVVDVIAWCKGRPGMGRRARCMTEYLVIAQKRPIRARGCWTDHGIGDCWTEAHDRGRHPHAKPHQLVERLIRATTRRGDLVIDPCAGGYGVMDACLASGREFCGCDLLG